MLRVGSMWVGGPLRGFRFAMRHGRGGTHFRPAPKIEPRSANAFLHGTRKPASRRVALHSEVFPALVSEFPSDDFDAHRVTGLVRVRLDPVRLHSGDEA